MSKKVLIIKTSLRAKSNSDKLADEFMRGAVDGGNIVEAVSLKNKKIAFCTGCLLCQQKGACVIKDDAIEIAEKMKNADVIVWATPIYYYEMSGQMKTLIDRCNSLYSSDYKFRDIYILSTAADTVSDTDERAVRGLEGWIECFDKAKLKGAIFSGGVDEPNAILNKENDLKLAYETGKSIN